MQEFSQKESDLKISNSKNKNREEKDVKNRTIIEDYKKKKAFFDYYYYQYNTHDHLIDHCFLVSVADYGVFNETSICNV